MLLKILLSVEIAPLTDISKPKYQSSPLELRSKSSVHYPLPTRSVREDTLVGVCVCVLALNRLIANFN